MNKKAFASIAGLAFAFILAAVFIANILLPDKTFSDEENRVLTENPEFTVSSYMEGRYEEKLESYANDQFLFRNFFIKAKTAADVTVGQNTSNGVFNCKDDYLMEEIASPDKDVLERTLTALENFRLKYATTKMYFLLAPNAANILSDKLPSTVTVSNQNKYMDDFFENLASYGYTNIDVRDAFKENSSKTQLYYRTDHHWTTDGAFLAYQTAVSTMGIENNIDYKPYVVKNDFRGSLASKSGFTNGTDDAITIYMPDDEDYKNSVIYYSDTKEKTTAFYQLDNLQQKDAYTVFGGSNHPMYTITTPTESKEKLLIVKDSYANSFIPFIAQNYREVVVVDPRYFFDNIDDLIKAEGITQVLFLYNANTFFGDDSLEMMLTSE